MPSLSIVIPTFHEAANINILIEKLAPLAAQFSAFEVIIVDDNSQDGTEQLIANLQRDYAWLKLIIRQTPPDLSLSVLNGLQQATHDILLVMDADLSHSPEYILQLIQALKEPTDFVIGSRFIAGGSIGEDWPWYRRCNAQLAKSLVKKLTHLHDPLSGFFCLRKTTFQKAKNLNPIGYKIGLELIIKCHCQHIVEIPIHFHERVFGESKLNWKQQLKYLRHIGRLYQYKFLKQ